jgi:hypothetical protein
VLHKLASDQVGVSPVWDVHGLNRPECLPLALLPVLSGRGVVDLHDGLSAIELHGLPQRDAQLSFYPVPAHLSSGRAGSGQRMNRPYMHFSSGTTSTEPSQW